MFISRVETVLPLKSVLDAIVIDKERRTLLISTRDPSFIGQQVSLRLDLDRDRFAVIPSQTLFVDI